MLAAHGTASTSTMVAKKLARTDSKKLTMVGTGSQSESQGLAFRSALNIHALTVWDTASAAIEKFVRNARKLGFVVTVASSASKIVHGSDIITTCTADKARARILTAAMVSPGVHVNAVGGVGPERQNSRKQSWYSAMSR